MRRQGHMRALRMAIGTGLLAMAVTGLAFDPGSAGERIYREGLSPDGTPLTGLRENQTQVRGAQAACVNCHRRSGLGNVEGNYVVPPITSKYLLRSPAENTGDLEMAHVAGYHQGHAAYTDASLARALREGVGADGRTLSALMPRYALDDAAMSDLLDYLRTLGAGPFPGVSDTDLQFATIVTPDSDPMERKAMLDVLERFFATQSEVIAAETRPLKASREIRYRVTRRWHLHVWELQGSADTWEQQLHSRFAAEPVFAVLSGIGGPTWAPIHRFCEDARVPCLFPNTDLPVDREGDFYSVYFSRGVLLEADLLAQWIQSRSNSPQAARVIQVYRAGDVGGPAGAALSEGLAENVTGAPKDPPLSGGPAIALRALPAAPAQVHWQKLFSDITSRDTLVLWLRPGDLHSLPAAPPPAAQILVSASMGGMEAAPLPPAWRARALMAYPFDLPAQRMARMNYPYGWFKVQHIPVTAERVQVNTYLACVITSETLGHMLDSFVPDYLLERLEMMISRRLANGYFPRLGLAPGQRFASKGGYVVHFGAAGAKQASDFTVIADTAWVVP